MSDIGLRAKEAAAAITEGLRRGPPCVFLPNEEPGQWVNTERAPLQVAGRPPTNKEIRGYIWTRRHTRAMARGRWGLWGWWDEREETSYVGIIELVEERVAQRLGRRSPAFRVFEIEE